MSDPKAPEQTSDTGADLPAAVGPVLTRAQQTTVVNIIRRAAKAEIMPRFRTLNSGDTRVKTRADDLVTIADEAAEAMMTRALQMAFPSALIVGEEATAKDPTLLNKIAKAPLAFILDPIDGTWNFAHGLSTFGVILAVTRFGRPAFGVIYDPTQDDWIIADDQSTPELRRAFGAPVAVSASAAQPLEDLTGFVPLHLFEAGKQAQVAAALPQFRRSSPLYCSAHEYRLLAQGHADFVLTALLHPWDHAAGALICARAGCHVEMLDGSEYSAARNTGHLLIAPDKVTWGKLKKAFGFLLKD